MKLLICLAIIVLSLCLGVVFVNQLKRKKCFWIEMVKLCDVLSANINFGQKKIKEILIDYSKNCNKELNRIINMYLLFLDKKTSTFVVEDFDYDVEKTKNIKEFFESFGELDIYNELSRIENYKKIFAVYKNKAEENDAKYGSLIIKLSLIFSILICILFA